MIRVQMMFVISFFTFKKYQTGPKSLLLGNVWILVEMYFSRTTFVCLFLQLIPLDGEIIEHYNKEVANAKVMMQKINVVSVGEKPKEEKDEAMKSSRNVRKGIVMSPEWPNQAHQPE